MEQSIYRKMASIASVRKDFPILQQKVNGKKLIYLDSGATSQKPSKVIQSMQSYYETINANVHRGLHFLSARATEQFEASRVAVANFINASSPKEIIFTRNTTEAINLVAHSFTELMVKKGDLILLTQMEHHSNIIPWQLLAKKTGCNIEYIPITKEGLLDESKLDELLNKKPKILSLCHVSNVLGTINDIKTIIKKAHQYGTIVIIDGAQAVSHLKIDVQYLDADFYAFSAHKMLGPTGIGILYGKYSLLEKMEPMLGGGEMIKEVTFEGATWNDIPYKFEAGTPAIAEAIGLKSAIEYLESIGRDSIISHQQSLMKYALEKLSKAPSLIIYGTKDHLKRCSVISFNLADIHPHDLTTVLDEEGIAIRSGHACAMPLMSVLKVPAVARASFHIYNDESDIDALAAALEKARRIFKVR